MNPCAHAAILSKNEDDQKLVCSAVFDSPEWILLDMGLISEEEGLAKMCARLRSVCRKLQSSASRTGEYCMWKIDAMETLVRELKTKGYGLYICSNASIRLPSICMDVIPAAECFDGMLFPQRSNI